MLSEEHDGQAKGQRDLRKHMYGTRAAADGWQQEPSTLLKSIGFRHGSASLCVFMHAEKGIATTVRGDYFMSSALKCELDLVGVEVQSQVEVQERRSSWAEARRHEGAHDPQPCGSVGPRRDRV